jgi:hypothetical protein
MRLAALALVTVALTATATVTAAGPAPVRCDSVITPGGTFSWRPTRVVLGVVNAPRAYIPQTVPSGDDTWPYWSKSGLVVRAESPALTISVPRRWRSRVAIGWGNVDSTASLRFPTCPDAPSIEGWNPYSGGFYLRSRTACVPLVFRVGERSATVRFGVGKRCR